MTTITDVHGSLGVHRTLVPRTHLIVSLECARPLAGSLRVLVDRIARVSFGRGARREVEETLDEGKRVLSIRVPDGRMSSLHATLERQGAEWILEDRGSKNGSSVGERAVTRAALGDGDVIRLGQTLFLFRQDLPTDLQAAEVLEAKSERAALTTLVPALARHFDDLTQVAAADVPVLLLGETGTGKEVVAKAIHALSRKQGDIITVNCGALPATLVESELFGHKKGAFSGAIADRDGFFRSAEGGTILLDEIGDLPLAAQVSLLRVLQEGEVTPVGASRPVKIDARVVAATNRDLEAMVRAGAFREDLLARIGGFTIRLPPLRERWADVGILVGAILRRLEPEGREISLTSAAGAALFAHRWPRNIRELEKCLARAIALAGTGPIDVPHLGLSSSRPADENKTDRRPLTDEERRDRLVQELTAQRGNLKAVARMLKTSRSQIHRWLKRFHLAPEDFRS